MHWSASVVLSVFAGVAYACESCESPAKDVVHVRNVRRMQPDAQNATSAPRSPLSWGQLNFLHTTDTHGWLEGHLKEKNYGADWGDYVSFVKGMRKKADDYGVDLLLVDTGDLHDGAGLSDATSPNGVVSNPIFENIDYDLLTIGNHELYVSAVAYEHFYNFSKVYGNKYVNSNVKIFNQSSGQYEQIGSQYHYFTTKNNGFNIMAFGVLYDFTGNSNASQITKAADMVKQTWFQTALNDPRPVDLYMIIGHNPSSPASSTNTFATVFNAIRAVHPNTPIQIFGGHTHIRDFNVYDDKTTALESGRYCETLGFLSMAGFDTCDTPGGDDDNCYDSYPPCEIPQPTQPAVKVAGAANSTSKIPLNKSNTTSEMVYFRRYLDWNRLTFEYHAAESQKFDTKKGVAVTKEITADRTDLKLNTLYGCAPQTWCISCQPFNSNGSIFTVLSKALTATVINQTRSANARMIFLNTGSVRFDLPEGPFTYDDSFIVSPFADAFEYIPNVPYSQAKQVLANLNAGAFAKREEVSFSTRGLNIQEDCLEPEIKYDSMQKRSLGQTIRRQAVVTTPGYTTKDDFGTDGDDTIHSAIPSYSYPNYFSANGNFPADGSDPATVDVIFLDFITSNTLTALQKAGASYKTSDVSYYLPSNFTTNSYLPAYAKIASDWQAKVPNCPVGTGIGSAN